MAEHWEKRKARAEERERKQDEAIQAAIEKDEDVSWVVASAKAAAKEPEAEAPE